TQSSMDGREKDEDERSFLIINVTIRNAPTENFLAEMRVFSFVPDKGDRAERPAHEKGNQQNQAKSQDFGPRTLNFRCLKLRSSLGRLRFTTRHEYSSGPNGATRNAYILSNCGRLSLGSTQPFCVRSQFSDSIRTQPTRIMRIWDQSHAPASRRIFRLSTRPYLNGSVWQATTW